MDIVQVRSAEGDYNHPIPFELSPTPFLELTAKIKTAGLDFVVSNVGGYLDPETPTAPSPKASWTGGHGPCVDLQSRLR